MKSPDNAKISLFAMAAHEKEAGNNLLRQFYNHHNLSRKKKGCLGTTLHLYLLGCMMDY